MAIYTPTLGLSLTHTVIYTLIHYIERNKTILSYGECSCSERWWTCSFTRFVKYSTSPEYRSSYQLYEHSRYSLVTEIN